MIRGDQNRQAVRTALDDLSDRLLLEGNTCPGSFHATEDRQEVRDEVYAALVNLAFDVDVTALEKRKAQPKVRESDATFYRYAWWFHFKKLVWDLRRGDELFVIAATLQTKKKKTEFLSALEQVVDQQLHYSISRRVLFWKDDADRCLQAADYGLWAVMRDLERGDNRAREQVKPRIRSVFQPFRNGKAEYY